MSRRQVQRGVQRRDITVYTTEEENRMLNLATGFIGQMSMDHFFKAAAMQVAEAVISANLPPYKKEAL